MIDDILIGNALTTVAASTLVVFVLHATVLLSAVWLIERCGSLKHPGWAEWAWRVALFGAFLSVAIEMIPWSVHRDVPVGSLPTVVAATASVSAPAIASTVQAGDGDAALEAHPSTADVDRPMDKNLVKNVEVQSGRQAGMALPLASDVLLLTVLAWLLGTLILSARMLLQAQALLRLRRRVVREGTSAGAQLQHATQTLAQEMRIRMPIVRMMPGLTSPLVLSGTILLPAWAEALDPVQQHAMLAHELAHLRRRDPLWRPLQRLALVPLFFHPLAWHALRRLETLAETLCDAVAVERLGSGRALAECLAECLARHTASTGTTNARHNRARRSTGRRHAEPHSAGWVLAMADHRGGIVGRVHALLENSHMTLSKIPTHWRWGAAVFALLVLIALPGVMVVARPGVIAHMFEPHALSVRYRHDGTSYRMRSGMPIAGETLKIDILGDVKFDARESDVVRMGRGATFEVVQSRGGVVRSIAITPVAGGLQKTYHVDGTVHPFDAEGKAWLAAVIPEMYRLTGLQAEARAKRLLEQGGVPRLLEEIALLNSDYVRAEYLGQLFAQSTPDAPQTKQALALLEAVESDFEKRRALTVALRQPAIPPEHQAMMLGIARHFGSDFERAEWLIAATAKLTVGGGNAAAWSQALVAFDSDFERKRALQALIQNGQPKALALTTALHAMRGMGSDFEQRSVLETAAEAGMTSQEADYLAAVDGLRSDFDKKEALRALIRSANPDIARSRAILHSVHRMGSDFERREVLAMLAVAMPHDAVLIEDYRAVTREMGDFERGQAEKALDRFYRG